MGGGTVCAPGCASLKCTYNTMECTTTTYAKIPSTRYTVPGTGTYLLVPGRRFLAVVPDADHPTRTITLALTLTLWGDQCLDAVACEGSRLIRPKGDAVDGGCVFQNSHTRVCM